MPFAEDLSAIALANVPASRHLGAYYGSADGLAPGAGLIYAGVVYPAYNAVARRFEALRGPVLILTHECDIDPANNRPFNKEFVLAPLILMRSFAAVFEADRDLGERLARDTARDVISRMLYLPPGDAELSLGAFIYLNSITSGHTDQLATAKPICALSQYALGILDHKLENHFRRPKAQPLPLTR